MSKQSCDDDLDELADVVCSYAAFCRDMIIPSCKLVNIYPNNKPWVKSSVKLKKGAVSELHIATKELKLETLKTKQNLKTELENKMAPNNLGSTRSSMKTITGLRIQRNSNHLSLVGFLVLILLILAMRFRNFVLNSKTEHFDISQNYIFLSKSHCADNICGNLP